MIFISVIHIYKVKLVFYFVYYFLPYLFALCKYNDAFPSFQAKKFVESTPQTVKADIPKADAEKLKEQLEAAGGKVEID